jgi:hypothetical protein
VFDDGLDPEPFGFADSVVRFFPFSLAFAFACVLLLVALASGDESSCLLPRPPLTGSDFLVLFFVFTDLSLLRASLLRFGQY